MNALVKENCAVREFFGRYAASISSDNLEFRNEDRSMPGRLELVFPLTALFPFNTFSPEYVETVITLVLAVQRTG
jgi:hypothetical protein